jgi:tRNA-splicing ligase RtcB (3'-phosphate/5'-hydroxy nucleic acid ligase)
MGIMPPTEVAPKLLSWASELDEQTLAQARRTARLLIIEGHVALMPDAHVGIGATVGSVIPTRDAIIPAAVGVDIGCGMVAVETDLTVSDLPTDLDPLVPKIERAIPAGVGKRHERQTAAGRSWFTAHPPRRDFSPKQVERAVTQFGTLGSGNHFLAVARDKRGRVWAVVHSGSRGIGNELATDHIDRARKLAQRAGLQLEDRDLAYFCEGTQEFANYVTDMLWAQDYARANREQMMDALLDELTSFVGAGSRFGASTATTTIQRESGTMASSFGSRARERSGRVRTTAV